jgi:hypothetical protein
MKKTLLTLLVMMTLIQVNLYGQENQTVKAEKFGEGNHMEYNINYNNGSYTYDGLEQTPWNLRFEDYLENHKTIFTKRYGEQQYFPDRDVFPATYIKGRFIGNPEQIEKYQVVEYTYDERMVILDEWLYLLEDWEDKDNYTIERILRKGELKGLKITKEAFSANKRMEDANHPEKLQEYLDAAFAKQEELLPAWRDANADLIAQRQENERQIYAEFKGTNDAFWASPEGQAILKRWEEEKGKPAKVTACTILNDLPPESQNKYGNVRLAFADFRVAASSLLRNQTMEVDCDNVKVYVGVEGSTEKGRLLFETSEDMCGKTINLSKYW